jgi:hypothetical protein
MNGIHCKCKSTEDFKNFPDLRWTINGTHYYYPKESYLELQYDQCILLISNMYSVGSGDWMMGINFWENYYMVFDNDNFRVGIAPSKIANKRVIAQYSKTSTELFKFNEFQIRKYDNTAPSFKDAILMIVLIMIAMYTIYKFIKFFKLIM